MRQDMKSRRQCLCVVVILAVFFTARWARADSINDIVANPVAPFNTWESVYPNWKMLPTSSFIIQECDDASCNWCTDSSIVGVTMFNYGTANGVTDISAMYLEMDCGNDILGIQTLTFAGDWAVGPDIRPAWTWAGTYPFTDDPFSKKGCAGSVSFRVYTDIGSCPTDQSTIKLGPGFNDLDNGGITDDCESTAPWEAITDGNLKRITYVNTISEPDTVATGDTVNYTIYIGQPGTSYTSLVVMDSMPSYTHLLSGSLVPAPDLGFNPDPGPPQRLRWTMPGGHRAPGRPCRSTSR
jgi:hypothetical protein